VAAESSTRLSQYIDESQMLLPKSSVAFENDKDVKVCSTWCGVIICNVPRCIDFLSLPTTES